MKQHRISQVILQLTYNINISQVILQLTYNINISQWFSI